MRLEFLIVLKQPANNMKLFLSFILASQLFGQSRSVVLSWIASSTSSVTYNIYRATSSCNPIPTSFIKINTSSVSSLTYTDNSVTVNSYCYKVTAFLNNLESPPSNLAQADVLPLPPGTLTISPLSVNIRPGASQLFVANMPVDIWVMSPVIGTVTDIDNHSVSYRAPNSIQGNNKKIILQAVSGEQSDTAQITIKK